MISRGISSSRCQDNKSLEKQEEAKCFLRRKQRDKHSNCRVVSLETTLLQEVSREEERIYRSRSVQKELDDKRHNVKSRKTSSDSQQGMHGESSTTHKTVSKLLSSLNSLLQNCSFQEGKEEEEKQRTSSQCLEVKEVIAVHETKDLSS